MQDTTLLYTDDLTQVKNRRYLKKLTEEIIPVIINSISVYTVAVVDLDHFKEVNDTYGHLKGDMVIKDFAAFLKENLRKDDHLIRYGGDEFVVFQPGLEKKISRTIWQRIINKLNESQLAGIKIGMSVGIASYPEDGKDFETLFKEADSRLYMAKRSGRGRIGEKETLKLNFETYEFVNREKEKEKIREGIEQNAIIYIKGPVGIGKTRLVREVLSTVKEKEILWSTCLPFNYHIPYYPIRTLINYKLKRRSPGFLNEIPLPYRVEVGKIVPQIIEGLKKEDIKGVGEMLDRYRLFEGINRIICHGKSPKIIVIDDVQWIDENSILYLKFLLANRKKPLSFVFTSRIEEKSPKAEEFLQQASRDHRVVSIELGPLKKEHQRKMLFSIMGNVNEKLLDYVAKLSGGNPFFTEELIKELHQSGYIHSEGSKWAFKEPEKDVIPKSIEDVVKRKLNELGDDAREILALSSVLGRIDIEFLKETTDYNEGHIIGLLEDALKKRILKEKDDDVEFQDELTRDIIYTNYIGKIKRRYYHRKTALYLEKSYKDNLKEVCEELAFHFKKANNTEKYIKYTIMAADKAFSVYANHEAITYYTEALRAVESTHYSDKIKDTISILKKRARVLGLVGRFEESLKDLSKALELAEQEDNKKEMAKIYEMMSEIYTSMGDYHKELKTAEKAHKLYREVNSKEGIATSLNLIGIAYFNMAEYEKALKLFKEFFKYQTEAEEENPGLAASIYNNIGVIYNEVYFDFEKAEEYFLKSLAIRKKINDLEGVSSTLNNLGFLYDNLRDYETSLKYYTESLNLSRKIGDIEGEAIALLNIGVSYGEQEDLERAMEFYNTALNIARKIKSISIENFTLNNIGVLLKQLGKYDESLKTMHKTLQISENINDRKGIVSALRTIGDIYLEKGEFERALQYFNRALNILKEVDDRENRAGILFSLTELYMEKGDMEKAKDTLKKLKHTVSELGIEEHEKELILTETDLLIKDHNNLNTEQLLKKLIKLKTKNKTRTARKYLLLAKLHAISENKENTLNFIEKSVKEAVATKLPVFRAKIFYEAGKILKTIDREKANTLLEEALKTFREHNIPYRAEKTEKELNP